MTKFILSNIADGDLADIFEYGVLNFGIDQATRYLLEINDKFQFIADNKELGRPAEEISKGLKRAIHNTHVIFYKEMEGSILIVRVLRREMDFMRHLY